MNDQTEVAMGSRQDNLPTSEAADSYWFGRRVLITGGLGFVAGKMLEVLSKKGAEITTIIRDLHSTGDPTLFRGSSAVRAEHVVFGNLQDFDLLKRILSEYDIEACLHLAAQAIVNTAIADPRSTFESNVRGTWNILEACRTYDQVDRVVVASSDKAYGEPVSVPISEDHPLLASHPYDASKACADIMARTYHKTYGMTVGVARCANTYGGGDLNFSRIIPGTIRSVLSDEAPTIRSDGTPQRDFLYLDDAVNAYLSLAEHLARPEVKGQAFNFGANDAVSVLDLVTTALRLAGKENLKPRILGRDEKQIQVQHLSSKKAKTLLSWQPHTELIQGLSHTIAWYNNNRHLWQRNSAR